MLRLAVLFLIAKKKGGVREGQRKRKKVGGGERRGGCSEARWLLPGHQEFLFPFLEPGRAA